MVTDSGRVMEIDLEVESDVNEVDLEMEAGIPVFGGRFPDYIGRYTISPKVKEAQELLTKNKSMIDDVLVLEIPYTEVHNKTGITFMIGGD